MAMPDRKQAQRHILVIDNDGPLVAELSDGLRAAGYRVTEAAGGEDALGIAAREAPDLAVLDVRKSDARGITLGGRLREVAGVPFLCLSEYADRELVRHAAEEGALGYLVKPLDIQQIVPSIEAALTRGSEISKLRRSEEQLTTALAGSREISMAVGLLMMRDHIKREQAFELLRSNARAQRRPVAEVATDLLDSAEKLYTIKKLNGSARWRKQLDG